MVFMFYLFPFPAQFLRYFLLWVLEEDSKWSLDPEIDLDQTAGKIVYFCCFMVCVYTLTRGEGHFSMAQCYFR